MKRIFKFKRMKKFKFVLLLSTMLTITSINVVYGYSLLNTAYQYAYPYDIQVKPQWNNYDYSSYFNTAINAWNSSPAPIWFNSTSSPSQSVYIRAFDYYYGNVGWDGRAYYYSATCNTPSVQLNDSNWPFNYGGQSNQAELIAHELGHHIGLNDVSNTSVLMRSSDYKLNPNPTQDDTNGVEAFYSRIGY